MRTQEATSVLAAPIDEVEGRLADVTQWSAFLVGLEGVERLGHERYRFRLADGNDHRDAVVCVRHGHAGHRFAWHSLSGPTYRGVIQLTAPDTEHTAVRLSLTSHPGSLRAGLADMVMARPSQAAIDLHRLEKKLSGDR
jgi:uncharacterized membrane protein